MRRFLILVVAGLLSLPVFSQQEEVYEISFTFYKESHLHVQVEIEGQEGVHPFIFDTGGRNILNTHRFGRRVDKKPAYLKMGTFKAVAPDFAKDDYSKRFSSDTYQNFGGMLGLELFEGFVFQTDYNKRMIRVARTAEALNVALGEKIALQVDRIPWYFSVFSQIPRLDASVRLNSDEIENLRFTLDTGNPGGFNHHTNVLMSKEKEKPFLHIAKIDTLENSHFFPYGLFRARGDKAYHIKLHNAELGQLQLSDQEVSFTSVDTGLIGNAFMKNYLVTVDMENETLYLKEQEFMAAAGAE